MCSAAERLANDKNENQKHEQMIASLLSGFISRQSGESLLNCLALAWQLQDVRLLSWETDLCSCNN